MENNVAIKFIESILGYSSMEDKFLQNMFKNIWVADLHIGVSVGKLRHPMFIYEWILLYFFKMAQIAPYRTHFLREENAKEYFIKLHNSRPSFLDGEYCNHLGWLMLASMTLRTRVCTQSQDNFMFSDGRRGKLSLVLNRFLFIGFLKRETAAFIPFDWNVFLIESIYGFSQRIPHYKTGRK